MGGDYDWPGNASLYIRSVTAFLTVKNKTIFYKNTL
jgi:hypothetical protein